MKVKKDLPTLADRAARIAEDTPRDAIAALLKKFMPARSVAVRPPVAVPATAGDPFPKIVRGPRRRRPVAKRYEVLNEYAHGHHRSGTWTYAMVKCAVKCDNLLAAQLMLTDQYPQYASRTIHLAWCAERGYIKFI